MAKKESKEFPLFNDIGHSFNDQRNLLNFKPKITYVEPEQEPEDFPSFENEGNEDPLANARQKTEDLIAGYQQLKTLGEQAQKRIDNRVKEAGGFSVKLDPIADGMVIAAVARHFPDNPDPTTINYDMYKKCLEDSRKNAPAQPALDFSATVPTRTDLGGYNNQRGENRPELNSPMGSVKPIDLSAFQAAGVVSLFLLMLPLIKKEDKAEILQHLATTPHKPF